jgi:transcriptional regulator GlxA family with amidase domain
LTFDQFNEMDSFVVAHLLNRLSPRGWHAYITAPGDRVTSRNGVTVNAQRPLEFTATADAVIVGSGWLTREIAQDTTMLRRLTLDPQRQLIASQCSGALILAHLGLLAGRPVCTDQFTRPAIAQTGAQVLDTPFHARGNVATAGGCLSSQYIAAWMIARQLGLAEAEKVIRLVAPVGEVEGYVDRALGAVRPFVSNAPESLAA